MKNAITFTLILLSIHLQGQIWTSREAFQGDSRAVSTSFTIGNKGYVGLGLKIETEEPLGDMWEYDPALDRWERVSPFIGDPRWGAFSFVINEEAYVGGGTLSPPSASANSGTFYKYNPISNSWFQEPNIPSSRSFSTGFSIDGKGYVVFGFANGERDASVIMYDPTLSGNPWTELTDIPEVVATAHAVRQPALSMILDNEAYLVGGAFISEVWKYNHTN